MQPFPLRRKEILERSLGEERMLYDTLKQTVHVLNSTAEFLWQRCDGKHSLEDIASEAATSYGITVGQALVEMKECLETMRNMSLLEQE